MLLSSGSTLLNIACSGNPVGAFLPGRYYLVVGDSSSGKTFTSTGICAECAHDPKFKKYRIVYDDAEHGNNIDIQKLFGEKTARKIEPPRLGEDNAPEYSYYIEDFYDNLNAALQKAEDTGTSLLYILDSMDVLTSKAEEEKEAKNVEAREAGKDEVGSYGDGKAKYNSQHLRTAEKRLAKTGSILIIISQTRDSIQTNPFMRRFGGGQQKTRSGGHALKFYATLEVWTSRIETLKRNALGKERQVGIQVKAQVKKNRLTGQEPAVEFPIYYAYGIDDVGSCIDFLIEEKVIGKMTQASKDQLAHDYDDGGEKMEELRQMVWDRWQEIARESNRVERRVRYGHEEQEDGV